MEAGGYRLPETNMNGFYLFSLFSVTKQTHIMSNLAHKENISRTFCSTYLSKEIGGINVDLQVVVSYSVTETILFS